MLRPGTRLRQMAIRGRAMAGVSAWEPGDLPWDVSADAAAITPVSNGTAVNSWANAGTLGGVLGPPSDAPTGGPRYRPGGGASTSYLEFLPSGGTGYFLGLDTPSRTTLGPLTTTLVVRQHRTLAAQSARMPWTTSGDTTGGGPGVSIWMTEQDYRFNTAGDGGTVAGVGVIQPVMDGDWHVVTWRRDAARVWTCWVDGQLVLTRTGSTDPASTRFVVGGVEFGAGFDGDVARAFYALDDFADADIDLLHAYLLANDPLLATDAKVMVVAGDSTSTDQVSWLSHANQSWLSLRGSVWQYGSSLQTSNGLGRFYSNSWGGKSTAQQRTAGEIARVAGWLSRGTSKRVLVLDTGTNDIRAGGAGLTPAQSYAQIQGLITEIRTAVSGRVEVVVCTICDGNPVVYPAVSGTPFTTLRNTLNGLITAGAGAGDYVVADRTTDPVGSDWGTSGRLDTWFLGDPADPNRDGLHRIAPGADREYPIIAAAVASVL